MSETRRAADAPDTVDPDDVADRSPRRHWITRARAWLPRGGTFSPEDFAARHRTVLVVLWGHVPALLAFGLIRGVPLTHLLLESQVVVCIAAAASQKHVFAPRLRAALAAVGLLLCSAILVHLSGGSIEMHFHFFVMVSLISLYLDWLPFLVAIGFVALHHAVLGMAQPRRVFDHDAAWAAPWKWALIHAGFVLAASAAQIVSWRVVEDQHDRSQRSLRRSERRFRALIEHSLDAVAVVSPEGQVVYDSASVERVLGFPPGHRTGEPALDFVHPEDVPRAAAVMTSVLQEAGSTQTVELRGRHEDGSWRWLDARVTNLVDQPDIGGLVVNFRDVTAKRQLEDELAHQAFHDSLTGLANRALFLDRLEHALTRQGRVPTETLAVLFVDLDDFKTVNDALGHGAGDRLLQEIGGRLRDWSRTSDTCARLGGDEFAVLIEGLRDEDEATTTGNRLLEVLCQPLTVEGNLIVLSASVGIVVSDGTETAEDLVRNADLAMFRAKRTGKGRFELYEKAMHDDARHRLDMREALRRAIDQGELVNHYQPIVDLSTGALVGAETLLRWNHPRRGVLAPEAFLEIAEETGLISPIGRAVLQRACRDAASWPTVDGPPLTVSVNLSPRQLQEPTIVADVAEALATAGLPGEHLTLEITESVLIHDPGAAAATLRDLKDLGVSIALDDFGTGFSSLSHLARFPVDCLKIDKSFIDPLTEGADQEHAALVDAILEMSNRLKLKVTAEGVERLDQVERLIELGCATGQGWHFAKAMSHEHLVRLLTFDLPTGSLPPALEGARPHETA